MQFNQVNDFSGGLTHRQAPDLAVSTDSNGNANIDERPKVKKKRSTDWSLLDFDQLPDWLQDNHFLRGGHRPPLPSYLACLDSIWRLHSETVNIWTHGLGCFLLLGYAIYIYFYWPYRHHLPLVDHIYLAAFWLFNLITWANSSVMHTLTCHSREANMFFGRLDYVSITLGMSGHFVPGIYFTFYHTMPTRDLYILLSIILSLATVSVSMMDRFSDTRMKPLRAATFAALGGLCYLAKIQWFLFLDGRKTDQALTVWFGFLQHVTLHGLAAVVFALRWPECSWPGRFDVWGHSHQIFHVLIIVGTLCYGRALIVAAEFRNPVF